jgi:hypothetical protein
MAIRSKALLAALFALIVVAPQAAAQSPLAEPRTHVDAAGETGDPEAPRLTLIKSDTDANDVRAGYLYVRVRCDAACVVEATASTKISGKMREVAAAKKTLPANAVRRIRLKIRADVRRRLAAGARFRFDALPLPVPGA